MHTFQAWLDEHDTLIGMALIKSGLLDQNLKAYREALTGLMRLAYRRGMADALDGGRAALDVEIADSQVQLGGSGVQA